jgi:adenosylcobyric acid synthase
LRHCVQGFVINKFRGDPALLTPGLSDLEARSGIPTLGVLPWVEGLHLDAEDSLALRQPWGDDSAGPDTLDVCVVRFPRISNFTDIDALALESGVSVRYVTHATALGDPDMVILPGTKATVADLAWLRARGFDTALQALDPSTTVLGICGGYQMLGHVIDDDVESAAGSIEGLGRLPVTTRFEERKITLPRQGSALGCAVTGYQIHHGRTMAEAAWVHLDDAWGRQEDGAADSDAAVFGTSLHGLFESDDFRVAFLDATAARRKKEFKPSGFSFASAREAQFDHLADLVESHLDMPAIRRLITRAETA